MIDMDEKAMCKTRLQAVYAVDDAGIFGDPIQNGYAPNANDGGLPKAPKGGTGESTKPASPTGSGKTKP